MRTIGTLIIGVLMLVVLGLYAVTYQVGYNEKAMLKTFGEPRLVGDGGGIFGNLHFRWPYPIQEVIKYDTRVRILEGPEEQTKTKDGQSVVIQHYVAWRIEDPLAFYKTRRTVVEAREQLTTLMRDEFRNIRSGYTFDNLTNVDPDELKLEEIEEKYQEALQSLIDEDEGRWGIKIESVGIHRVLLTPEATPMVFAAMTTTQERLAAETRSEGESQADKIKAEAEGARRRILSFADTYAKQIEAEGHRAVARQIEVFKTAEEFAVFLRRIEALEQILKERTTFLIGTDQTPFDQFEMVGAKD